MNAGELVALDAPDDLAVAIDLDDAVTVTGGDQGVAIGFAESAVDVIAVAVVTGGRGTVGEAEGIRPDDLAGGVVLADFAVGLVTDEIMAVGELAGQAGVAVGVGLVDSERGLRERSSPRDRPR